MAGATSLVMYEAEQKEIQAVIERLTHDSRAKACFVIDKNGQALASAGQVAGLDITSLASLTAGSISATGGLLTLGGIVWWLWDRAASRRDDFSRAVLASTRRGPLRCRACA